MSTQQRPNPPQIIPPNIIRRKPQIEHVDEVSQTLNVKESIYLLFDKILEIFENLTIEEKRDFVSFLSLMVSGITMIANQQNSKFQSIIEKEQELVMRISKRKCISFFFHVNLLIY